MQCGEIAAVPSYGLPGKRGPTPVIVRKRRLMVLVGVSDHGGEGRVSLVYSVMCQTARTTRRAAYRLIWTSQLPTVMRHMARIASWTQRQDRPQSAAA